jgi:hypothetical protein
MKWEYMTVLANATGGFLGGKFSAQAMTDNLNRLGLEGWELVSAFDTNLSTGGSRDVVLILKRAMDSVTV